MHAPAHRPPAHRARGLLAALILLAGPAVAQPNVGVSTVRAQRFGNENLTGFFTPQTGDRFAFSLAAGDFDGDGADDLATGMPFDDGPTESPVADSGSVVVRYSVKGSGLTTNLSSVYLRPLDVVEPGDRFGFELAACDLNGDGYDDLAVGIPFDSHLDEEEAGIVQVHYGSSSGLPIAGDTYFAQSTEGVPENVEEHDWFGFALACGDFNGDTFDDLAVSAPTEGWGVFGYGKGWVVVVPGSPAGLAFTSSWSVSQDSEGMADSAHGWDDFGWDLAAGDFDNDGYDDLVIGVPGEGDYSRGAFHLVFGGPGGLRTTGSVFLDETAAGGNSETGDHFGENVASGDVDGDGFADLILGVPAERAGGADFAGQVMVLFGAVGGFDLTRTQSMTEELLFGAGTSELADQFGGAVAVADIDQDGYDDIVAGHHGEALAGPDDGAATVVMGSAAGLDFARARTFSTLVAFGGGAGQAGERFGFALAAGDFDADGHGDIAIGAPWEDEGGIVDVGAETVLYGALFADGVESGNTALWSQTSSLSTNNLLEVTSAARLGPPGSRRGIRLDLINPDFRRPGLPAFVRVGPEAGFAGETSLSGSFHVNPQGLTMSTNPGANSIRLMTFADGVGAGSRTHLIFFLVRNPADGDWLLTVFHFNADLGSFQFTNEFGLALDGSPDFSDIRVDFTWARGNPGRLTMGRTRFVDGVPAPEGRIQAFATSLPGMQSATVDHVFVGMVGDHRPGTFGTLDLDEISFRRGAIPSLPSGSPPPRR